MESSRRNFLLSPSAFALAAQGQPPRPAVPPLDQALPLRFRQVHLDFHTSEAIPDVAKDFDPDDFASTLHDAHVNSVTVFGRCHHGWIYYDTKLFPERKHPNLKRANLLKEQVEAFERHLIARTLTATGHNQSEAARRLGTSRVTILDKIKRYRLDIKR